MDTHKEDAVKVNLGGGNKLTFNCVGKGLYMCDFSHLKQINSIITRGHPSNHAEDEFNFATLVSDLKDNFTKREVKLADEARNLYKHLGMPSFGSFIRMIENARRALHIYGQDIASLKGRTVRLQPPHVPPPSSHPLPPIFLQHHRKSF